MYQALYIKYLIQSSSQYSLQVCGFVFIFYEETEAQREQVMCPRSHLRKSAWKKPVILYTTLSGNTFTSLPKSYRLPRPPQL